MSETSGFPIIVPENVPPSGFFFSTGDWALGPASEGIQGVQKLDGKLAVYRHGVHLLVEGQLSGSFIVPCDRCGASIPLAIEGSLACLYSPISAIPERNEEEDGDFPLPEGLGSWADRIEDQGEYEPPGLDARNLVREFFALERPGSWCCEDHDPHAKTACEQRFQKALSETGSNKDEVGSPVMQSAFSALAKLKGSH
jgi:uncharacterized metal-binding protein YceD (DUF177 family)